MLATPSASRWCWPWSAGPHLGRCAVGAPAAGSPGPPPPQQAAARERTRQARRLAAEWPLAQTLVTATVAAMAGAGLADYQQAAG
jgi:hypothetical protein